MVKNLVKKIPGVANIHRRISWPLHVMRDQWATRYWHRTSEVVTPHGFRLCAGVHPAYIQMQDGTFEQAETAEIVRLLEKTDVFIDVGANLGYYCLLARLHDKRVVAFEPQQQNLKCLYRNLESNAWEEGTEVFPIALAAKSGLMTLYGASGPSASLVKNWAQYSSRFRQTVPVSTLDRMLSGNYDNLRLLIKIDVEGAEYGVLKGAIATLTVTPRPAWIIELCLHEFHPGGNPHFRDVFELFWENGYSARIAGGREITPEIVNAWVNAGRTAGEGFNYVFE